MTFLSDLARLREEHKKYGGWDTYGNLSAYFMRHAEAIEELVKAAEWFVENQSPSDVILSRITIERTLEKLNRSE